jgi:hypothetical protein
MSLMRKGVFWMVSAIAILEIPLAGAQQTPDPPAAPVPLQVLTAQKVFLSSGDNTAIFGVPNLTYDEFYAYLKSWGRFELVATPVAADLILNLRFADAVGAGSVHLDIVDRQTQVVLWKLNEPVQPWNRTATGRKNYDQAMATLVGEMKILTTPPPAAPDGASPSKRD